MVAVIGVVPAFTAANAPMLPVPEASSPIEGVSLVQLKVAPAVPVNVTAVVLAPLHTTWSVGSVRVGVGLTVMVNICGVPTQVANTGVTVMVAITGTPVAFTPVNTPMLPVPLAASPMDVVLLVQLKVVPPTAPLNVTAVVLDPLHTTWLPGATTVGVGFTVIVNVWGVPVHTGAAVAGVTIMVATMGVVPALVAVKAVMLPVPEASNPMLGVSFVQL
jgi:hypothetical protein